MDGKKTHAFTQIDSATEICTFQYKSKMISIMDTFFSAILHIFISTPNGQIWCKWQCAFQFMFLLCVCFFFRTHFFCQNFYQFAVDAITSRAVEKMINANSKITITVTTYQKYDFSAGGLKLPGNFLIIQFEMFT